MPGAPSSAMRTQSRCSAANRRSRCAGAGSDRPLDGVERTVDELWGAYARRGTCLSAHCDCSFSHDYARLFRCVEVTGSHVGSTFNRKVCRAVASAVALPELPTTTIRCKS